MSRFGRRFPIPNHGATHVAAFAPAVLERSLAETALTTDTTTDGRFSAVVADAASTADAITRSVTDHRAFAETAATTDSLATGGIAARTIADSAVTADTASPAITHYRTVTTTLKVVSTAFGYAALIPPEPLPGPTGLHDYQVIVCDKYGVAIGQINTAVPTQIDWTLNAVGQALIDFDILDPSVGSGTVWREVAGPNTDALLPIASLPGGREIQIWRDGQLIWWGVPTSASFDAKQVHLTCQGLLWYISRLSFGPITKNYASNPNFEQTYDNSDPTQVPGWILASGGGSVADITVGTAAGGYQVLVGTQACRIVSFVSDDNIYAYQDIAFAGGEIGLAVEFSAWFYIDGAHTPTPSNLGIQIIDADVPGAQSITPDTPVNQWTRISCDAFVQPGDSNNMQFQIFSQAGIIYWDQLNISVQESVGSALTGSDAAWIIEQILTYCNDPTRGKSDLAMPFAGPSTGKTLVREYQFFDNAPVLDALNEYPTIGVLDFDVTWDATGHYRQFQIFPPAKGSYKYNYPVELDPSAITDLQGSVDGTQTATAVRWLGQGSTGSSEDIGYSAFPSLLGGRIGTGSAVYGSTTITAAGLNFTAADIGQPIYGMPSSAIPIGTVITSIISSTQAVMSNAAVFTISGLFLVGIGGTILETVQSALPDQMPGTLQGSSDNYLQRFMEAQFLPTPKMRADGPTGFFGNVETGDVIPVSFDYGWLAFGPRMARVATVTLYPVTEEMSVQLSTVPILEAIYT